PGGATVSSWTRLPAGDGPDLVTQTRRLRACGRAPIASAGTVRVVDRTRHRDQGTCGPAPERARDLGRPGTLGAEAREQEDLLGAEPSRLADGAWIRRTHHEPDAREPSLADELLAPLPRELSDAVPDDVSVAQAEVLDVRAAGVRRLRHHEQAGPVALARGEKGLDRLAPEVRIDGDRVGHGRPGVARLDVRRRIRARRRADVAALRVRDHEQTGVASVGARVLEGAQAGRSERLEECELRLHRHAVR